MLNLRNPFIFAPIKTGFGDGTGLVNQRHINFYLRRAKYLGAVIPEPLYLHRGLREIPQQIGIDSEEKLPGLKKMVDAIHSVGAKVIAHLNHPGRMANPQIPGNFFVSSTDKPCENGGATPKRMTRKDMDEATELFVNAAQLAKKAGFDIIELQFGHGYLLAQFLSPAVNDRDDEYGGSLENRMRFPLEVLDAVMNAVDLPIIVRVSGDEMTPGGLTIDDTIQIAQVLKDKGVAAVHISAGTSCSSPPWFFQHMFVPTGKTWEMAKKVKDEVGIPVIAVGKIGSAQDIDRVKNYFGADYIAIGRGLVADPDMVGKYLGEVDDIIRPCLTCSEGCLGGVKAGLGLQCVVNPLVGDDMREIKPAEVSKKFVVVGAGPAGLECATTLKKRGHQVVIYEKDKIGGQFNLASLPPHKETLARLIDYYKKQLDRLGIEVIHGEATAEDILSGNYDAAILATGSVPAVPPIEGLKEYFWAEVLYEDNLFSGKKVVIIGGGLIGTEIASALADRGNEAIIVEMLDEIARGMEMLERKLTLQKLTQKGVKIFKETRVSKIDGDKVYLEGAANDVITGVDHIILATGMRSYNPLGPELEGKITLYVIGDARQVGKVKDAIRDGFELAVKL
ncbi:FAD-dependent oxidoreductase [bacterium]|nr:FAD-dependent oxidoreductase [bacterium]